MKASARMKELVSVSEKILASLGFKFARNGGDQMVEFDVTWPEPFVVRITHLGELEQPSAVFGMFLPSRQSESTDLRIVFPEDSTLSRERAGEFVRGVLGGLKRSPWDGLGMIESGTSKALWKRASEGRY